MKMIKDYKCGKLVMLLLTSQAFHHLEEQEPRDGPASLQAKRLTKSEKGYIRLGETSGDLD